MLRLVGGRSTCVASAAEATASQASCLSVTGAVAASVVRVAQRARCDGSGFPPLEVASPSASTLVASTAATASTAAFGTVSRTSRPYSSSPLADLEPRPAPKVR